MPHSSLAGGFSVVEVKTTYGSLVQLFAGRFDDKKLHILGWRDSDATAYFSESECASGDFGLLILPKGRKSLADLVKGDVLRMTRHDGKPYELDGAKYVRQT